MDLGPTFIYRKATKDDRFFLLDILALAAAASGVRVLAEDIPLHPDIYAYVEGFPQGGDLGLIAETSAGVLVGAIWLRLLPDALHAIHEPLPELSMGILPPYQHLGIGTRLLEELYSSAWAAGIPKLSLGVYRDNIPALGLYRQQHWVEDGYFQDYIMMSRSTAAGVA